MNRMFSEPHCIFSQLALIRKLSIVYITNNIDEFYHDTDHFIKFIKIVQYFSWVNVFTVEELSVGDFTTWRIGRANQCFPGFSSCLPVINIKLANSLYKFGGGTQKTLTQYLSQLIILALKSNETVI